MNKVFISSTYIDLIPHRRLVFKLLENFKTEIRGMEAFGARSSAPLDICIEQVCESDIYIGIIGMRYGSIDAESSKSFTEVEYETAYKQNKEILIYLFDEKQGLITPNTIDFENYLKLSSFKKGLKSRHTIDTFKNETELAAKIKKRLEQLLQRKNKEYIRPKSINCKVTRFKIKNKNWFAFIGYLFGSPIEFYLIPNDCIYLPRSVLEGEVLLNIDDYNGNEIKRYDFRFIDDKGYRTTIAGISFPENRSIELLNIFISESLKYETDVSFILSVIPKLPLSEIDNVDSLIRGIKKAVNN